MFTLDGLAEPSSVMIPTVVVHSDESAEPENGKKPYESVQGIKELLWSDGKQYA